MRDAFVKTMDNEEGGMMGRIDKFSALLKEKDEEVGFMLKHVTTHFLFVWYLGKYLGKPCVPMGTMQPWSSGHIESRSGSIWKN